MPKKKNNHPIDIVRNDIFFVIWIFTFAILIYLTKYFPEVIYEMIVVSIIFLLIFLFEPIIKMSHGSKITEFISGGKYVEPWKRFPIFFGAIMIVFVIKHELEIYFEHSFDVTQINVVFVLFWLIALFAIYYLIFTKQHEDEERDRKRRGSRKR